MKAAALDRRVTFQRATLASGPFGREETWADHGAPVWGSLTPISDGERWRAGEVAAHITARVRVRYSAFAASLTAKDRLTCEGRAYEIVGSPREVGRREFIELTISARTDT